MYCNLLILLQIFVRTVQLHFWNYLRILILYNGRLIVKLKKCFIKIVYRYFLYLHSITVNIKKYETELLFILDIVITLEWM